MPEQAKPASAKYAVGAKAANNRPAAEMPAPTGITAGIHDVLIAVITTISQVAIAQLLPYLFSRI
jgi:hypothetical protein